MVEFDPKVALITGGGSGIGAAFARKLAGDGTRVIVADLNLELARKIADAAGAHVEAVEIDVAQGGEIESLVRRIKAGSRRMP